MDPVSFAFATISVVDVCIKYGNDLYARCQAYKHAETQLQEATLCIQDNWIKIEHQISALRNIWEALDGQLQIHQNLVLQVLQGKLQNAVNKLDSLVGVREGISTWNKIIAKRGEAKRLKYAAYAKASLDGIIDDLGKWQRMFDPSWFFLARITAPVIDQQLTEKSAAESKAISTVVRMRQAHEANEKDLNPSTSIFLQEGSEIRERESITFSSASTGCNSDQRVIVDHIPVREQTDFDAATKDVRDLARILSKVDPASFGLLFCQGVIKVRDPSTEEVTRFDFIFPIPPELGQTVPRSLRSLVSNQKIKYPLNERFHLAVSLARSVMFLHSSRFVHKSISPENIIVLQPSPDELGTPFLVGFERFRPAEGRTYMSGDVLWEKNLYRHPRRQGLYPEEQYTMRHDIYSVGVCLLEIGLWVSFVSYSEDQKSVRPGPGLLISELIGVKDQRKAAMEVKAILVEMAQSRLPGLMGNIYTDIVVSCLTCLDKNNEGFGDEKGFEDEDGILVGLRYIEKVLFEMEKIVGDIILRDALYESLKSLHEVAELLSGPIFSGTPFDRVFGTFRLAGMDSRPEPDSVRNFHFHKTFLQVEGCDCRVVSDRVAILSNIMNFEWRLPTTSYYSYSFALVALMSANSRLPSVLIQEETPTQAALMFSHPVPAHALLGQAYVLKQAVAGGKKAQRRELENILGALTQFFGRDVTRHAEFLDAIKDAVDAVEDRLKDTHEDPLMVLSQIYIGTLKRRDIIPLSATIGGLIGGIVAEDHIDNVGLQSSHGDTIVRHGMKTKQLEGVKFMSFVGEYRWRSEFVEKLFD